MDQTRFRLNRKALLGMMVLAAAGAMPVHAATINVTTTADGVGVAGCSLREAVIAINTADGTANGCENSVAAEAYGTNDTINLPAGTYVLSIPGGQAEDWYAASIVDPLIPYVLDSKPNAEIGDLDLMVSVKIVGDPAGTIIDGGDTDRVFQIVDPTNTRTVDVSLSNLTVQNGTVDWVAIDDATPEDPLNDAYWLFKKLGGGIATGVAAAVTQYVPTAHGPGVTDPGMTQQMGAPGGEEEVGATYSLTLNNVAVVNNVSAADGGGIYNVAALTADGVVIAGNTAGANGGGLYNEAKTLIRGSKISNNTAEGGGAIFLTGSAASPVYVIKSSIMDNTATGGGGISARVGPGLYVTNSTVSGNTGNDVGGGIYTNGVVTLVNSTVVDNRGAPLATDNAPGGAGLNAFGSGSFTLWNTLLANNTKLVPEAAVVANCGQSGGGSDPTIISKGHNLESLAETCANLTGTAPGLTAALGDLFGANADAKLAARDDATGVFALETGSSAINAGDSAAMFDDGTGTLVAVTDDQLGTLRPAGQFDIGAYELASANTVPPAPTSGGGGGGCAVGSDGRLDPTLPAMLAAALAFFGLRRRAAK